MWTSQTELRLVDCQPHILSLPNARFTRVKPGLNTQHVCMARPLAWERRRTRRCGQQALRVRRVLQSEAGDGAASLAQEVVRPVARREKIRVVRVPRKRCHLHDSTTR